MINSKLSPKKIRHFYERAESNAKQSKLPVKVGAVLVDPIRKVSVGDGYNGFSKHIHDSSKRLSDPYYWRLLDIHAEMNCILHTKETSLQGFALVTTRFPCAGCASILSQVGISTIYSPPLIEEKDDEERFKHRKDIVDLVLFESEIIWKDINNVL